MIFLSIILSLAFCRLFFNKINLIFTAYTALLSSFLTVFIAQTFLGIQVEDFSVFYSLNVDLCVVHVLTCCALLVAAFCINLLIRNEVLLKRRNPVSFKELQFRSEQVSRVAGVFLRCLLALVFFICILFLFSCQWALTAFGNIDIGQIIYHLQEPMEGTASQQIYSFIFDPLNKSLIVFSVYLYITQIIQRYRLKALKFKRNKVLFNSLLTLFVLASGALSIYGGLSSFGIDKLKAAFLEDSNLFEDHYVKPQSVQVTFPEQKRNLIYIFVESLETTYISKDLGGVQPANLLPNLSELAQENVNFSNSDKIGGAYNLPGANYTVAGMVAQTSGTPIKVDVDLPGDEGDIGNSYGEKVDKFMPGVYSLGEFLAENGYNQELLLGSPASFAGRDKYFTQHGNYTISDYNVAKAKKWIPEDYNVWWGYEDEKLFEFAKQRLEDLSSQDQPFNLTLLTADTHFEDGYMSPNTPEIFDDQYSNVIHWSDEMISEFIRYVMTQPYFENTTIILSGDHLSMDRDFFNDVPDDYQRSVFNLIVNSAVSTDWTKNRKFSTMDLYPTTLAALGATIDGDRLGLGTNLFSTKPTLMEELGYDQLSLELQKKSPYYNKQILQNQKTETGTSSSSTESSSTAPSSETASSSAVPPETTAESAVPEVPAEPIADLPQ